MSKERPIIGEVFVTKYALTKGIVRYENVEWAVDISASMIVVPGRPQTFFHVEGRDWHRTFEGAQKRAMVLRDRKVSRLQQQIKELEARKFAAAKDAR